ncbi:DegT/DnrJ/EryC1/StrS family aminotransferase [Pontibacter fetidus]|uniref:DegT/DnrJ/EryC1/StrS family aminotransferase n=1 Tax=Pontibacter fetidus TaxID=2700082 RepID=A0A6B2HBP5_9BACT|nr:DegT/DnrJ/EryC1/StrS family aminotransferase [Pontibacter fetidus]NDK57084.1 DegT/DnrJ/EryC1/StrS family aminotransferase [Pontibacter fetidus]
MQVPYVAFRDWPVGITQQVEQEVTRVLREQQFILGPDVQTFEDAFAKFLGAGFAIGVGSGFDALVLALKAVGVGPSDEVIIPANTFIATANAVAQLGATPVLAEPDKLTYNLTADTAAKLITTKTKAIVPVHLYGQTCQMDELMELCESYSLKLVEDAAQAHGATYKNQFAGTFGDAAAFSFYPTKNLGAVGDGGAVVTSNPELASFVSMYRNYGQQEKYHHQLVGINSRLDTLQAAVLRIKLKYLRQQNKERQRLANQYLKELQGIGDLMLPVTAEYCSHVYHIFNIRTSRRNELKNYLQQKGIQTAIHYPVPIHLQPAYSYLKYKKGSLTITEEVANTSLSLPLFPGLSKAEQEYIIQSVKAFFLNQDF